MREWKGRITQALASAGHAVDDDVVEELSQHATAAYASARAEGVEEDAAIARVERLIATWVEEGGRLKRVRRSAPAIQPPAERTSNLAGLLHDLRYAWRICWRRPGPAIVAALTMALGIGATTTLFSVTWSVLLKPLPFSEPETLIRIQESREGATRSYPWIMTNGTYLAWAEAPNTIEALGAYSAATATLTGHGEAQRVRIVSATASLFSVLRAVPLRGALFTSSDEIADNVAVISHGFWQRAFGGRDDAVGATIVLDGKSRTIAGVLPPDFTFPERGVVAWVPYHIQPSRTADGGSRLQMLGGIARLKPGATPAQAADEATARARSGPDPGLAVVAVFGSKGPAIVSAERLIDAATGDVRSALWVLMAAVGLLLITATANIASVQLARAASRRRELAIRISLGARGGRLARQLILESLVVGLLGGAAGIALAFALNGALPSLLPPDFPRAAEIALDMRVLVFAVLVTLVAGVLCGTLPAIQAARLSPRTGMIEDAAATGVAFNRSATARLRAVIMVGQVAVACLLLAGAALAGRTFLAMLDVDRGYEPSNVLTATIASPSGLFTDQRRTAMLDRVLERLRARPDVVEAGATTVLPLLRGDAMMALQLPPLDGGSEPRMVQTGFRVVSPGYFEALGMRTLEGRTFTSRDTTTSMPALVVNRAFMDRYLPGTRTGRTLPLTFFEGMPEWELIGVVDNVRMRASVVEEPGPEIFVSYLQAPGGVRSTPTVVVRTRTEPGSLVTPLRQLLSAEEPSAALESVMTMEERVTGSLARPRMYAAVLGGFALFALAIASVGLFGVLSYAVAQRSKEFGVRAALGARRSQLVAMVIRQGLVITVVGIVIGLAAAAFAARALSAYLFGVQPVDALSFAVVALGLLVVSLIACAVPALRAAHVDPLSAIRQE